MNKPLERMLLVAAPIEAGIAIAAYFMGGTMALVAALVGTTLALGAAILSVALLKPAMKGPQAQFQQKWVLGMAARFGSFIVLAVLMIVLKDTLPAAWMGGGYLGMLLVLLFAETRFLT